MHTGCRGCAIRAMCRSQYTCKQWDLYIYPYSHSFRQPVIDLYVRSTLIPGKRKTPNRLLCGSHAAVCRRPFLWFTHIPSVFCVFFPRIFNAFRVVSVVLQEKPASTAFFLCVSIKVYGTKKVTCCRQKGS